MSSTDDCENRVFADSIVSNVANSQLDDDVITNEPEPIIDCSFDLKFFSKYSFE